MATKKDLVDMMYNLCSLSTNDAPIKKTGTTTFDKIRVENGTAGFNQTKNVSIAWSPAFTKVPTISITMTSGGTIPLYKVNPTINGFSIKCSTSWSGDCDWEARERP